LRKAVLTAEASLLLGVILPASYVWRYRSLERWCAISLGPLNDTSSPGEVGLAVERIGRRLPGSRCLDRALVGLLMLRRRGYDAQVVMGAAKDGDKLAAHAWVAYGGAVLVGAQERDAFVALERS
jgi:hypothetical protein